MLMLECPVAQRFDAGLANPSETECGPGYAKSNEPELASPLRPPKREREARPRESQAESPAWTREIQRSSVRDLPPPESAIGARLGLDWRQDKQNPTKLSLGPASPPRRL